MKKKNQNNGGPPPSLIELMPNDPASQRVLDTRAKSLSKPVLDQSESKHGIDYVRFKLGENGVYGIPYQYTKEVISNINPTKVPHTAVFLAGIINRQGSLISVLNLKKFFHIKTVVETNSSHLVVVSVQGITIAILVDSFEGSGTYEPTTLSPSLQFKGAIKPEYFVGLHHGIIAIINIEALISDLQINGMNVRESQHDLLNTNFN